MRSAEFEDAESYRKFLLAIPVYLARDVMLWAYVSEDDHDNDEEEVDDD